MNFTLQEIQDLYHFTILDLTRNLPTNKFNVLKENCKNLINRNDNITKDCNLRINNALDEKSRLFNTKFDLIQHD